MHRNTFFAILLSLCVIGMALAECALFHFPLLVVGDVFLLTMFILLPGLFSMLLLSRWGKLNWTSMELFSLSAAIGFGVMPGLVHLFPSLGIGVNGNATPIVILISALSGGIIGTVGLKKKLPAGWVQGWKILTYCSIAVILFFAAYNLQPFHYGEDGSIVVRGLFGVDLPFLAGEIQGIRDFGSLHDLHQLAQSWHYHDWTYQLLAILSGERTLPDLALAAPLVGYVLLAFSVFTLVIRLTSNKYIASVSTMLWFLVSGIDGGELGSYALSPSFVFGSVILVNLLLAFDLRMKAKTSQAQWICSGIIFLLLIELSQTKLSSYLAIVAAFGAIGVMGMIASRNKIGAIVQLLSACALSFGIILWQNAGTNALMPSGDFLIGAPLAGYANHLAAMLHVPVSSVSPVSHGLQLRWQSLLIIPYFVFHLLRFVLTDPKMLSALIVLSLYRGRLWKDSHELMWMLLLLLAIGFLLPVLYSPAWYPLALSFYAPLVSAQVALLIVVIGFGLLAKESVVLGQSKNQRLTKATMGLVGIIFLGGIALNLHRIIQDEHKKSDVIPASLIHAMEFLQHHTSDTAIVATHRFDLDSTGDESYYWYAALAGRTVVSEGAKYGSFLTAIADTNAEKGLHRVAAAERMLAGRRALLDTIFSSQSDTNVQMAIASLHIDYIVSVPSDSIRLNAFGTAQPVYSSEGYRIWNVANGRQKARAEGTP